VRDLVSMASGSAFIIAVLGAITYLFVGDIALNLFDHSYHHAFPALLILAAGQVMYAASGPSALFMNMAGGERDLLVIRAAWGGISLVTTYFAAKGFGLVGAALSTSLALTGWTMTAAFVCRVRFGISTTCLGLLRRSYRCTRLLEEHK
jgi:O-antigen/teichoic acid export membrane protein